MPRSGSDENEENGLRRSRRTTQRSYKEDKNDDDDDPMEEDDDDVSMADSEEDEELEVDENEEKSGRGRRRSRKDDKENRVTRTSSRSTKFKSSMADPPQSLKDLFDGNAQSAKVTTSRRGGGRLKKDSPHKSPARRHSQRRRSFIGEHHSSPGKHSISEDASISEEEDEEESDEDSEEEEEPLKVQRIIASRTETRKKWKEICKDMNTSEVHYGSRWFQEDKDDQDENTFEERFLVKWAELSFLHNSWETQDDLIEQCDAKTNLSTFFRKAVNGLLYTQDERSDGDYFDPAYREIERILEVLMPDGELATDLTADKEDTFNEKSFDMIMDKADPEFDNGAGRQFLIKWCNLPYTESTYEFERDLIINDIEYKDAVKHFLRRSKKPYKSDRRKYLKSGEDEYKRLYKFFGDKSKINESEREKAVEEYKQNLQKLEFKNGGELRDYQAEGVAWMISNFVNQRSCLLADEMGLGKTLQTAATVNILANTLNRGGPTLIVAPLSTLAHWYREFNNWTDLNTIIYHGSAEDRRRIRETEFVYECDRPQTAIGFNQVYLKKCAKKHTAKWDSPWMIDVVVTTPEMMVADDAIELMSVQWEVLVVDEAHRMKNHNSKLSVGLRNDKFTFRHRILLTGTPIQNDMLELWSLMNFMDPEAFDDSKAFMARYGDMKSKERVDEMHEEIRPYILRRLKEDVERSVPPKEETLIEVELTIAQKQYYRALYEKNVKFLHKNKKKALDGPSLNNLAMQLRKCCNHLFLLNGVEEEFRKKKKPTMSEGDFLTEASGKLVLLDKLLPRLKEEGHRVLIFSQFKIMLDILEDYLNARTMKYERIDGSITGHKRQKAIDRFQTPNADGKEPPFIMMLSTRAGGVGITLTAADTCIILDSDWNPQNDLQAQARCHRIGQTKSVKVYRLLTRKTYEMQMFHMSSLKMGLDQAVLKGFESGSTGDGALTKDEVERLLRHGAYDIFNEDKSGDAEAASNEFVQQDIDSILQRHSRTVVHDNTGSKSNAAGGTFSKASFKARTPDPNNKGKKEDIDIEDPDFWKKMIGEGADDEAVDLAKQPRRRKHANYSDREYMKQLEAALKSDDDSDKGSDSEDSSDEESDDGSAKERTRWGGTLVTEWKKDDADNVIRALATFGYGRRPWYALLKSLNLSKEYSEEELQRLSWTAVLISLIEHAEEEGEQAKRREQKAVEKSRESENKPDGGVLAVDRSLDPKGSDSLKLVEKAFQKLIKTNAEWLTKVITDAVEFAKKCSPRDKDELDRIFHRADNSSKPGNNSDVSYMFATNVWPSLKNRGWKATVVSDGNSAGKTIYSFAGKEYKTYESVLQAALALHPELQNMVETILSSCKSGEEEMIETKEKDRQQDLSLKLENMSPSNLKIFLERYGSIQLVYDRTRTIPIRITRKLLSNTTLLYKATSLIKQAVDMAGKEISSVEALAKFFVMDKRMALPHPAWTVSHDSTLIHAIAQHGWIEQDDSVRAIAQDNTIKWGPPFDSTDSGTTELCDKKAKDEQLLETAERAAKFLSENSAVIGDLKGFDLDRVVRTFGLTKKKQEGTLSGGHFWEVETSSLFTSNKSSQSASNSTADEVDLPPKKDLVKRAKSILSKSLDAGKQADTPISPKHDYASLDQRDAANAFLSELLRAILKEPYTSKHKRKLCVFATEEARRRAASLSNAAAAMNDNEMKAESDELCRIADHIEEVKRNLTKVATQYKNVLRVILGEEPQKPRKDGEGLFPPKKVFSTLETTTRSKDSKEQSRSPSVGPKATAKSSGEKAIDLARKRLIEHYSAHEAPPDQDDLLLLTEIETLIISAACSLGIPVWGIRWQQLLDANESKTGLMTWKVFGKFVYDLALKSLERVREKMNKSRHEYEITLKSSGKDEMKLAEARGQNKPPFEEMQNQFATKENVLNQASEYVSDPETLAKKTVMLLVKVRNQIRSIVSSAFTTKSDYGLGANALKWLYKDLGLWAKCLDLLDDDGEPLGFTAYEFVEDLPEPDQNCILLYSIIDRKGCRAVTAQISMMTRLRSIFDSYDKALLFDLIEKSVASIVADGDIWEKQPDDWFPSHDAVMLNRLMVHGLTDDALTSNLSFFKGKDIPSFSSQEYRLSRGALQLRANQLTRLMHWLDENRENSIESGNIKGSSKHLERVQSLTNGAKKKSQVIDLASTPEPDCEDYSDVEIVESSSEKRKSVGVDENGSAEKKQRLSENK